MLIKYWWLFSLLMLFSYFIGNFCAAVVISNKVIHKDIRAHGSKNAGTTNMTRVFGIKYGMITFMLDFFKGLVCVLVSKLLFTAIGGQDAGTLAAYLAGLAVILGHNYPVLLGLKGGKGFASGIGVYLVIQPLFTLLLLVIGVIVLFFVDRISVFALAFFLVQAIYHVMLAGQGYWWLSLFACVYLVLAVIAHRSNIVRLIHGEEKPLGLLRLIKNGKSH